MLQVKRFINELMSSNCYIVWDDSNKECIVIDPGSEYSHNEISFISNSQLRVSYIVLTHEHSDHNWGVNSLKSAFPKAKIMCHILCARCISKPSSAYFKLYFDRENYSYSIKNVDYVISGKEDTVEWNNREFLIIHTPGHSEGSSCIVFDKWIFSGDSLLQYKPYIDKRTGSLEQYRKSEENIRFRFSGKDMTVYPGHGEPFKL